MLSHMRGLEIAATAALGTAVLPFLSAWDLQGPGGQKYRETVKRSIYWVIAPFSIVAGFIAGAVALVGINFYPGETKDACPPGTLPGYAYRRAYRGRHFCGRSVRATLGALA